MKSSKPKCSKKRGPYKQYWVRDGPQNIPKSTAHQRASTNKQTSTEFSLPQPSCSSSRPQSQLGLNEHEPAVAALIRNHFQFTQLSQQKSTEAPPIQQTLSEQTLEINEFSSTSDSTTDQILPEQDCCSFTFDTRFQDENQQGNSIVSEPIDDDSFDDQFCQNFHPDDGISEEESCRLLACADGSSSIHVEDSTRIDNAETTADELLAPSNVDEEDSASDSEELAIAPQMHLTIQDKIKVLLLLATKNRHKLTYSAAENIMEFSNILSCDEPTSAFGATKYIMKRAIDLYSNNLEEHHVCPECGGYIGVPSEASFVCCNQSWNTIKNREKGNFFIYLSLEDQLRTLLENCLSKEDIFDRSNRKKINSHNFEDIYDGTHYKQNVECDCLTLNFFVDGVQTNTTAKNSAWPVLVSLNEIPLHLRRKYLMMASIWLSKTKPNCKEYLKPFVEECNKLRDHGVKFKRNGEWFTFKFQLCVGIADSVARPLLRETTQFNGKYGCGMCYHPGFRVPFGRGHVRSYSTLERSYPLRTHQETMEYARQAEERRARVKGVKGFSVLSDVPNFDIVNQLDPDSFHCLVNVAKRFTWLWFDEKFHRKAFNIVHKLDEVDKRLLAITPTADVSRFPRSLKERSDWRGHEWYFWIVMYSIACLKNVLPAKYLNHWCQLPYALALIMQNSVARSDVGYSNRYLLKFVSEIDQLYGVEHVTFSVHLLTHLGKSVLNFAQPWCHSAFIYEAANAEIKNLVKSSNGAIFQICKGMQLKVALKKLEHELTKDMNQSQIAYLKKMTTSAATLPKVTSVVGDVHLLGVPHVSMLRPEVVTAVQRAGVQIDDNIDHLVYYRCLINNEVFHSTRYLKAKKQNNYTVSLEDGSYFIIDSFLVPRNSTKCLALGYYVIENTRLKICDPAPPHLKVLKNDHDGILRCIPAESIESKLLSFCLKISANETVRFAYINVLSMEMLD